MDDLSSIDAISDFDMFFYYGKNDLSLETLDVLQKDLKSQKRKTARWKIISLAITGGAGYLLLSQ